VRTIEDGTISPDLHSVRQIPLGGIWRAVSEAAQRRIRDVSRRARDENGQAIVEFTLILPIFVALIFIAIGYGITLNNYLRVADIARVAALDGSIARFDSTTPECNGVTAHDCICNTATAAATQATDGLVLDGPVGCDVPNTATGEPLTVTVTVKSENAIRSIPFMNLALPDTLTSKATVVLQ
jgi:Flp pilus assembly protein TadG